MLYKFPRLGRRRDRFFGGPVSLQVMPMGTEGVRVYAIVESGGKQYRVEPGAVVALERISGDVGSQIELTRVLLVSDGTMVKVGRPILPGAKIISRIVAQTRGEKIDVFKFKKRKKYRRKTGHRQELTRIQIAEIVA
jgi:large subunit ribosomal protein L21